MMRGITRVAAAALAACAVALGLTGCLQDKPGGAVDWLADQPGVVATEVLADQSNAWTSRGVVRGELDPQLDAAGLAELVAAAERYSAETGSVVIRLGRDGFDVQVAFDAGGTASDLALWESVLGTPGIVTGTVVDGVVSVRTLRDDAPGLLAALAEVPATVEVEGLRDEAALAADRRDDDYYGQRQNRQSVLLRWGADCAPGAELELAPVIVADDAISGAELTLCSDAVLYYVDDAALADELPGVRAGLDAVGLGDFPVTAVQTAAPVTDARVVAVSPGAARALDALAGFADRYYTLDTDRVLTITDYEESLEALIAALSAAPATDALTAATLVSSEGTVSGPLGSLPTLADEVRALDAASEHFGGVTLTPTWGSVTLESSAPDPAAAAAELKATSAWSARDFHVQYLNYTVVIADGVAALADPGYVGAELMVQFVDAWNGG